MQRLDAKLEGSLGRSRRRRLPRVPSLVAPIVIGALAACGGASAATPPESPSQNDALPSVVSDPDAPKTAVVEPPDVVGLETAFARAVDAISPAVVSVTAVHKAAPRSPGGSPFEFFFGPSPGGPHGEQHGLGSGVIVDTKGHILTNNHVVAKADEIRVRTSDDEEYKAKVVGTDPKTDLAVIKIDAPKLTAATMGDSDELRVGQWVLAVGSPFGLDQTVSAGIVSAVGRGAMGITDYEDFIQTDAAINPGNSGGPLIDLSGRVVGVNTAIASRSGGSNGIGFAIPSAMANRVAKQLIAHGRVVRGWMGVMIGELDDDLAQSFDYSGKDGVIVQDVLPDGPADKAGLREGDIITGRDGRPLGTTADFRNDLAATAPGTTVDLEVWRNGATKTVSVKLGELPDADTAKPSEIGMALADPNPQLRKRLGIEADAGAVVIEVAPGSIAAAAGLRPGDVIEKVGGREVTNAREAEHALATADLDKGVRLRIRRGDYGAFVMLHK